MRKMENPREKKKVSVAIIMILMICLFVWLSITVAYGFLLFPQWDFFSTKTENEVPYQDYWEYSIDGVPYPFTCWMSISTASTDGFLVSNNIHTDIVGIVEYTGEGVPEDNVTIQIHFSPVPIVDGKEIFGVELKAKKNNAIPKRFDFSYSTDMIYTVSGPKKLQPTVEKVGLDEMPFLDIEPAYITTQLKMTKAVVILTLWVVFFSVPFKLLTKK